MTLLRTHCRSVASLPVLVAGVSLLWASHPAGAASLFTEVTDRYADSQGYPEDSRYFEMQLSDVQAALAGAPMESFPNRAGGLTIVLPLPGDKSEQFVIWETQVMHPDLAAKFPEIKTYTGRGVDDRTASVRLDTTPHGFHAMILSAHPAVFIDPLERGNTKLYVSHYQRNRPMNPSEQFSCDVGPDPEAEREIESLVRAHQQQSSSLTNGTQLRTYRLAVGATGEYTTYYGGTVPLAMAGIVTSVNRVTGVYEDEVSVRMQLVPNNNLVVYTNGATDPYTNNNGGAMLTQNQTTLDSVIGTGNYDIGHAFSTGGGGIAQLSCVCKAASKAKGVTGSLQPIGDNYDIDYVAHEMGHQFGGTHSFNGNSGACNGNRTGSTAWEPGSGTTIMSYAGICAPQNITPHSTPEFHGGNFDQIVAYTQVGFGNTCPVITPTGNNPPVAVAGNSGLTIPVGTPFVLFGSGSDPDGDTVFYSWEEFDLGPAGHPDSPVGNAAIFRSFPPVDREWRMFPKRIDVRTNVHTLGELLPTYTRTLNLRLTARDYLGGEGHSTTVINVDQTGGPFLVTSVDVTPWNSGEMKTIAWDVAGTDLAPISCSEVNILLSTDDGVEFPISLAAATPNDGSEQISVPNISTTQARVKVEAVGNVFFDMSNSAHEIIGGPVGAAEIASTKEISLEVQPNPFTNRTRVSFAVKTEGQVQVNVYDALGRHVSTLLNAHQDPGVHTVEWNGYDKNGNAAAPGIYFMRMQSQDEVRTARSVLLR